MLLGDCQYCHHNTHRVAQDEEAVVIPDEK